MRRRDFIKLIGGISAGWLSAADAQQANKIPKIGVLWNAGNEEEERIPLGALREGLRRAGYIEGQNVAIEYRWGRNQSERLSDFAKELVQRAVTVIVACGGELTVVAAQAATRTIPIVATIGSDPVEAGFVRSLNRPEGNLTAVSVFAVQLVA